MKVLVIVCLLCGLAIADEKAAKQYFEAGAKAYAAQNFAAAAANFDEAYKEMPMPEIAFSAAQAYRRLYRVDADPKHVRRAVELYQAYLAKVKTGGRVGDASDNLGEMQRELDKLGGAGRIKVEAVGERTRIGVNVAKADQSAPDATALREIGEGTGGALVGVVTKLDGKQVEPFALLDVPPGDHVISVSADGYFPLEKTQRAVQGATALVEVTLLPKPARVTITTEAGAKVSVDGRPSGSTMLELATGKHVITVLRRGRVAFGRELTVTRGQELTLAAPLAKTGRRRAVPWVLGGAGALTVLATITGIASVVADGRAIDARDQIAGGNASPAVADEYDRQVRRRDDLKTSTIVLGAGALVAGAVGLGLYLFDSPGGEGLRVTPVAGPSGGGVTLDRRF